MTKAIPPDDELPAAVLLRVARGFRQIIWAILSGLLMLGRVIRITPLESLAVPLHTVGCLLGVAAVAALTTRCNGPLRAPPRLWAPALLNVYFLPPAAWWIAVPYSAHLLVNVFLAMGAAIWFLTDVCRHASRTARVLGDVEFAVEARRAARIGGIVASGTLVWMMGWSATRSMAEGISLYGAWFDTVRYLPWWLRLPALTPLPLALMCAWRAARLCDRRLSEWTRAAQR